MCELGFRPALQANAWQVTTMSDKLDSQFKTNAGLAFDQHVGGSHTANREAKLTWARSEVGGGLRE